MNKEKIIKEILKINMTLINFEEVKINVKKSGKCLCGKYRQRSRSFYQTINPFNKNQEGKIKTREEILVEIKKRAIEWKKEPIMCSKCK